MSKLAELKQRKQRLLESAVTKDSKKVRRQIEAGMDDLLSFKGIKRRKRRISTSQSFWNNEFRRTKIN